GNRQTPPLSRRRRKSAVDWPTQYGAAIQSIRPAFWVIGLFGGVVGSGFLLALTKSLFELNKPQARVVAISLIVGLTLVLVAYLYWVDVRQRRRCFYGVTHRRLIVHNAPRLTHSFNHTIV